MLQNILNPRTCPRIFFLKIIGCGVTVLGVFIKKAEDTENEFDRKYDYYYQHVSSDISNAIVGIIAFGSVITAITLVRFYAIATNKRCILKGVRSLYVCFTNLGYF